MKCNGKLTVNVKVSFYGCWEISYEFIWAVLFLQHYYFNNSISIPADNSHGFFSLSVATWLKSLQTATLLFFKKNPFHLTLLMLQLQSNIIKADSYATLQPNKQNLN